MEFAFGPVPSRRLGKSLGVNNIEPKTCTYSCVYCQLGKTLKLVATRKEFYDPQDIIKSVKERVHLLTKNGIKIDYITFVPDGEPTLDINLGKEISSLKELNIKIAVITNASLLWDENVKNDLILADWISLKIDTVNENIWKRLNIPFKDLSFKKILEGILDFSKEYSNYLTTETMLVKSLNDTSESIIDTAKFIGNINPRVSYISVPTRPPAFSWVEVPDEKNLLLAYNTFKKYISNVETLTEFEGEDFTILENDMSEILNIIAVHPMREEIIMNILQRKNIPLEKLYELVKKGYIKIEEYNNQKYYIKNLKIRAFP